MVYVIQEQDIFKHLVYKEDGDKNRPKDNMRWFLNRLDINIFTNEYYILYKSLHTLNKYESIITYDVLSQVLLNNISTYIHSPQVTLYSNDDMSDIDRANSIVNYVLGVYETLIDMPIDDDDLKANTEFYISTYVNDIYTTIISNQQEIINEGKTIGREFYTGVSGAKAYVDYAYRVIETLVDSDKSLISDRIDTGVHTYEEIEEMSVEAESGGKTIVTGIDELDEIYEIHKGELITVQAGSGVGKTRAAVGLFTYSSIVELGKTVLVLTLEQKSTRILPMYQSRHVLETYGDLGGVSDRSIIRRNYPIELQPQVEEAKRDFVTNREYGRLVIDSVNLSTKEVKKHLEEVWESGVHFDVVVLDYIGLLQTEKNRYDEITDVINMFKSECKSFKGQGFTGVIINQLTKEAEQKLADGAYEEVSKLGGSESQYIVRASDYVFTLHQTLAMKRLQRIYLIPSKVRLGESIVEKHELMADLGTCSYMSVV